MRKGEGEKVRKGDVSSGQCKVYSRLVDYLTKRLN